MPALTFSDHGAFHQTAIRSVLGAALGGLLTYAAGLFAVSLPVTFLPAAFALAAACGRGWRETLAAGVAGALCGAVPSLMPLHPLFGAAALGAGAGLIYVFGRKRDLVLEGASGKPRPGRAAIVASILATAAFAVAGTETTLAFESHNLLEAAVPPFIAAGLYGATFGLFLGLGSVGAHIVPDPDPVEAFFGSIQGQLAGDLRDLAERAMGHYRKCNETLAQSALGPVRADMGRTLGEVTLRILQLAARWQTIDRDMGERAGTDVTRRLEELRTLRESTKDEVARRQLQGAERTLHEELTQIERIQRGRERVVARLHADMAVLERTRFALLGLHTSDSAQRTTELASLSDNLASLAKEMVTESEATDEVLSQTGGLHRRETVRA